MIRRSAASFFIRIQDRAEIQLLDDVADVQRQMIVTQPLSHVRRQEQHLVHVVDSKGLSHAQQFTVIRSQVYCFFPTDSERVMRFVCADPKVLASLQPWAKISERLRRY